MWDFAARFSRVQHVKLESLNQTRLTHLNRRLHIHGTEIIAMQYIYEKIDTDFWENMQLILNMTTALHCSLFVLPFFLMSQQGKPTYFTTSQSKTFCC